MSEFVQGMLTGFVLGSGITLFSYYWHSRRITLDKLNLRAVDPHGDLMSDTQIWEPSYRDTAQVSGPEGLVSLPVRVLCKDCRHLGTGRNAGDCLAAPVPSLLGPIDQITGEYRPQSYKLAVMVNENFNCKNWKAK